jgi:hypothetical protein
MSFFEGSFLIQEFLFNEDIKIDVVEAFSLEKSTDTEKKKKFEIILNLDFKKSHIVTGLVLSTSNGEFSRNNFQLK